MKRLVPLLLALLALAGCATGKDAVVQGADFEFVAPGGQTTILYDGDKRKKPAAFSGESLTEPGRTIRLDDYAGKVVLVNVWGSWCGPCRTEAAQLEQAYGQTKASGVEFIGVDVRESARTSGSDFVHDRGITFPSLYDPPARTLLSFRNYPATVVPTTIVLDRAHRVAAVYLTPLLATDLVPVLRRLAAEQ